MKTTEKMREKLEQIFEEFQSKIKEITGKENTITACIHELPVNIFNRKTDRKNERIEENKIRRYMSSTHKSLSLFSVAKEKVINEE